MIKNIVLTSTLVAFMSPALAASVTVDEMQYVPKEERQNTSELATAVFEGETVQFGGFELIATKGLKEALAFIDTQEHMTELRRDTMRSLAYSGAFTIQNASDSITLQKYAPIAAHVATCGYFSLDKPLQFTVEKVFSKVVENENEKARFIAGSFELADLMPLYTSPRLRQDDVMMCSEKMKQWLP